MTMTTTKDRWGGRERPTLADAPPPRFSITTAMRLPESAPEVREPRPQTRTPRRPSRVPRAIRSSLWLLAGVVAVWLGNTTVTMFRVLLSPSGFIEQSMVDLFGSGFQWAGLLALIPVVMWATGTRIEAGLFIPLALFATGNGVAATEFLLVLIGTGLFLHLEKDNWQGPSLGATGSFLVFALINPWAAVFGLGVAMLASAGKKEIALPSLVVLFPGLVAALLLLFFFSHGEPTLIDAVAAVGIVALHFPLMSIGVGVAVLMLSFVPAHPAAVLSQSFGVIAVDAPIEITPELLALGFVIDPDARFELVQTAHVDATIIGESEGWFLIQR